MSAAVAKLIVDIALAYLAIGAVFAVPFALEGAGRLDADARAGSPGFRLIILPGAAALWPLLALRWLRAEVPREESTPHRRAARRGGAGS